MHNLHGVVFSRSLDFAFLRYTKLHYTGFWKSMVKISRNMILRIFQKPVEKLERKSVRQGGYQRKKRGEGMVRYTAKDEIIKKKREEKKRKRRSKDGEEEKGKMLLYFPFLIAR